MNIVWLILIPTLILFAGALGLMWVPLPRFLPPPLSQGRNLLAAISTGILGLGYLVALSAYLISAFLGAGRALDRVCTSLGLVSYSHALFGRAYHGSVRDTEVSVDFMPARAIAPGVLNIHVRADLPVRIAIAHQPPLLDCADCPPLTLQEPNLDRLVILAEQEAEARVLLDKPTVRDTVIQLMADAESADSSGRRGELYFQPQRIWFRTHLRHIEQEQFRSYLEDLVDLAKSTAN